MAAAVRPYRAILVMRSDPAGHAARIATHGGRMRKVMLILVLAASFIVMSGDVCDAPSGTACYSCGGAGEKQQWTDCPECKGGLLPNGHFCHNCEGRGGWSKLVKCEKCNGTGVMP
jgi:hypothetical protein